MDLHIMKSPWCTFTHQRLSNSTKIRARSIVIWEILPWQNKANKLPSVIVENFAMGSWINIWHLPCLDPQLGSGSLIWHYILHLNLQRKVDDKFKIYFIAGFVVHRILRLWSPWTPSTLMAITSMINQLNG